MFHRIGDLPTKKGMGISSARVTALSTPNTHFRPAENNFVTPNNGQQTPTSDMNCGPQNEDHELTLRTGGCSTENSPADPDDPHADPDDRGVKKQRKQHAQEFFKGTSLHGIKYFTDPKKHNVRRFVWLILFIAAFIVFVYITQDHLRTFFKFETVVSVKFDYQPTLPFPAVTICNFNIIKRSGLFNSGFAHLLPVLTPFLTAGTQTSTTLSSDLFQNLTFPDWNVEEVAETLGHQIEDMVLECAWGKQYRCRPDDFELTWTDTGPCFTFNGDYKAGGGNSPSYIVNGTASDQGLWIRLNLEQYDYLVTPYDTAGFKVLIHEREDVPAFLSPGIIQAPPGYTTTIPLSKTVVRSKKLPYVTDCIDSGLRFYDRYSLSTCVVDCLTNAVLTACGCLLPYTPVDGYVICDFQKTVTCAFKVIDTTECPCNDPCLEVQYNTRVSLTSTPAQYALPKFMKKYNMTADEIRNNIVDLYIYFEDMRLQVIEHNAAYDLSKMASDVGGEIGLLLGASILTLFEFFDYVTVYYITGCSFVKNCYCRFWNKRT